ncbi:MAG: Flp pilus assembly protein CpaB [Acetobacter sp.]
MNPRVLLIAFLAIGVLGGVLFYRVLTRPVEKPHGPPPIKMERVMVATRTINVGGFVRRGSNIAAKSLPASEVPVDAVKDAAEELVGVNGAVMLEKISSGAVLRLSQIVREGSPGFLSAALSPDMRAVSVQVTDVSSVGGLVQPGDRVDLILTQTLRSPTGEQSVSARGLASNLRVVGVNQRLLPKDILSSPSSKTNGSSNANETPPTTVTLEVTAEQAVSINVAADMGSISLAIRSSQGDDSKITSIVEGKQIGGAATVNETKATVRVYNGAAGALNVQF